MNDAVAFGTGLQDLNDHPALDAEALLRLRAVAVVRASRDPRKPGGAILRNHVAPQPRFAAHAVNPHRLYIQGAHWWPRVHDLPPPWELGDRRPSRRTGARNLGRSRHLVRAGRGGGQRGAVS